MRTITINELERRFGRRIGIALTLTAVFACVVQSGCGSNYPDTVPVSGHISLDGGEWPSEGALIFNPIKTAEGSSRRSGTAHFDTAGNFTVKSWDNKEGIVPGTYKIRVECWKVPPTASGPPAVSYVAERFCSPAGTPLEVVIDPGETERRLELEAASR